jgi:hypothetical protein
MPSSIWCSPFCTSPSLASNCSIRSLLVPIK